MGEQVIKPWGAYEDHYRSTDCVFKLITVHPGQRLSLQSHALRSETWLCLSGCGAAIMGDQTQPLRPGSKVEIGCGVIHRLINTGDTALVVAELQTGQCDEVDIVRLEDDYGRGGR